MRSKPITRFCCAAMSSPRTLLKPGSATSGTRRSMPSGCVRTLTSSIFIMTFRPRPDEGGLRARTRSVSRSRLARRRGDRVKRRAFITLLGGAAAWPLSARAQQREHVRRIGVLNMFAANDQEGHRRVAAFLQALQPLGWTIGRNVAIEHRWGSGDPASTRKNAEQLAALAPDVILTNGAAGVAPLLQATRSVPIVFVLVADPVGAGFVDTLAHPGGNA